MGETPSLVPLSLASSSDWPPRLPTIVAPAGTGSLTTTQLRSADASTLIVTLTTSPRDQLPATACFTASTFLVILYPAISGWVSGTAAFTRTNAQGPAPPDWLITSGVVCAGSGKPKLRCGSASGQLRLSGLLPPKLAVVTPAIASAG